MQVYLLRITSWNARRALPSKPTNAGPTRFTPARAEKVGCISTKFRISDVEIDKICTKSFKDPKVEGVVRHVGRTVTDG